MTKETTIPAPSYPPVSEPRSELLRVPVSPQEKAELKALAAERGRSIAEVVRLALVPLKDADETRERGPRGGV